MKIGHRGHSSGARQRAAPAAAGWRLRMAEAPIGC